MDMMAIGLSWWDKAGVIAGIVTSVLFLLVLGAQIAATSAARKAADAATEAANAARASSYEAQRANDLTAEESSVRLRPWIGIGSLTPSRVFDGAGQILARADPDGR